MSLPAVFLRANFGHPSAELTWPVVETAPVSEAIKTCTGDFERHIENDKLSLQRLGAAGIEVVVDNFLHVLDWMRPALAHRLPNGCEALRYAPKKFAEPISSGHIKSWAVALAPRTDSRRVPTFLFE